MQIEGPNKHRVGIYFGGVNASLITVKFGSPITADGDGFANRSSGIMVPLWAEQLGDDVKGSINVLVTAASIGSVVEVLEA